MAGGGVMESNGGARAHLYEYKITSYFIFACIVGSMGGSLFGYDLGVSGGVTSMDDFLKEFFPSIYRRKQQHLKETDYCKYDNQILTLFTSSLYLAALISTFGASHVTRNKGRRASIICGSISFFAGAIMNASARNVAMLIIGRVLLGFGIGFGNQAVPLYLSEMAPARIRGAVNQLFQLTTCLGILVANFVNYGIEKIHPWGWRLSLGLAAVPATFMFVGGILLPETPNSLVEQGRLDEARKVLEKVRGTNKVDAEFQDLVDASIAAKAIKHPFANLFERKNRPQLVLGAIGIPAFQQLTGMNSILFYAPVIFQSLGFGSGAALYSAAITSSALVVATLISMAFVDKFGRRAFFLEAGFELILCSVAIGITLALCFGQGKELPKGIGIFLVVVICVFVLAYGRSWGPLGWLVPSELFPLETRSAGQSMVVCVNMIFTAVIAQGFLAALCHLKYGIFLLFAGLIFVMSSFIYFLLPETKQVPIEEIHLLWQKHWFWKRSKKEKKMAEKSKILVIGGTGYIGKFIVEASAKSGHPTFALVRETAISDPAKAQLVEGFKNSGVTLVIGDLYDHDSLVKAIKQVDVVISAVGQMQLGDQDKIIAAIKEAGNVKRFFPSEFGNDVDRTRAVEPAKSAFEAKAKIRRAIEAEGIPYTYVSANYFAGYSLPTLAQPGAFAPPPPRDKVVIYGDGNAKAVFNEEHDIGTYTIKAVDDPRTLNKIVYIKPANNIYSFNELVALWEKKIGKTLEKDYIPEELLLKNIQESPIPVNIILAINHSIFIKGDQTYFTIEPSFGVEASELYPDVKYTTVEEYLSHFV